ncbi:GOLPH3/VPS74 family protein [Amycolatopsis sp. H20-H5]|uniref:GOLPH3/VPS74 family protein n=1 Tax=Amycolatopsis sp. H20-H5 TaxID=3046309 RepID=UPI002DBB0287|nr:GPP34 family phosphoprotein [Amycolatopsis sp. H20-H5]MEC3982666.1 GPP34 family phosphoprotein [Amycolatopsis sp. H20-H5]
MRRLTLVDSVFLLGHDEFTGKPVLTRTMLGIGLGGAVLCDLLLADRITVERKKIQPISHLPTGMDTADQVLSRIRAERDKHLIRAWVDHLRDDLPEIVTANLLRDGVVSHEIDRVLLRRIHRYPPVDLLTSTSARSHARSAVLGRTRPDPHSASLALLAWTIGVDDLYEGELDRAQVRKWMDETTRAMPRRIADVISGVEAVGAAVVYTGDRR